MRKWSIALWELLLMQAHETLGLRETPLPRELQVPSTTGRSPSAVHS